MFRLDLKYFWTYAWLLDCCTDREPTRLKISYSVVYSKPQNSIWIKTYAVSTDGPFLTDCVTELSRTVRNWRRRAYCKSGTKTDPYVILKNTGGSKTYVMISYGTISGGSVGRSINVSCTVCQLVAECDTGKKKMLSRKVILRLRWNRNKRTTTTTVHGNTNGGRS